MISPISTQKSQVSGSHKHAHSTLPGTTQKRLCSVVVGQIISSEIILQRSGLREIVVDCGAKKVRTVSTKSNITIGMKTAFAKLGTVLNGGEFVEIKEYEGVESSGHICSIYELGLGETTQQAMEIPEEFENGTTLAAVVGE